MIQLTDVNTAFYPVEVKVLESGPNGQIVRACKGQEMIDLCYAGDAIQIKDLANQATNGGFELAVFVDRMPNYYDTNRLAFTVSGSIVAAANSPANSDGTTASVVYEYQNPSAPRCFHLINTGRGLNIIVGRLWRQWTGQQALILQGDGLAWA